MYTFAFENRGVCLCVRGGGGGKGFVDISCRDQIWARFGKAVS